MKHFVVLFSLFLVSTVCSGQLSDTFYNRAFYTETTLQLHEDGTFEKYVTGRQLTSHKNYKLQLKGYYLLRNEDENKVLIFLPKSGQKQEPDEQEAQELVLNSKDWEANGAPFYHYIVEYDTISYLMNQEQAFQLTQDLNAANAAIFLPEIMLRNHSISQSIAIGKTIKSVFPIAFRDYILDKPVSCTILKTEVVSYMPLQSKLLKSRTNIYFDKGQNAGLLPGMKLYCTEEAKPCVVEIKEVTAATAIAHNLADETICTCKNGVFRTAKK